jgi:hypothetical protein
MCNLLLLLGHLSLHLLLVEQLAAMFELEWKFLLKHLPILFDFLGVSILESAKGLSILLLSLEQVLVPLLVELLVLLDVGLLAVLLLLGLVENKLLQFLLVVLVFKLLQSFLCHLGLNVLALSFTVVSVLVKNLPIQFALLHFQKLTYIYSWMLSAFGC